MAGGAGRPQNLNHGYFAHPTVFADVAHDMTIAQQEIFGPVLAMTPFDDEEEAIGIANSTSYGNSAYVQSGDPERQRRVAYRLCSGVVQLNGAPLAAGSPFAGYKQSSNGREGGRLGAAGVPGSEGRRRLGCLGAG